MACDRAPQPRQLTATAVVSTDSTASAAQLPVRMTANAWASKAGSTPDSGPTSMVIRSTAGAPRAAAMSATCVSNAWQMDSSCTHPC